MDGGAVRLSGSYSQLLDYIMFAVLVFYILTIVGLFVLRFKWPAAPRPYRALGYPVLPALYIVMAGWICIVLLRYKPQYTWPGLVLVLLGIPVYFLWSRRRDTHPGARRRKGRCRIYSSRFRRAFLVDHKSGSRCSNRLLPPDARRTPDSRRMRMAKGLFATKPISTIMAEAEGEGEGGHTLKRALGPINLITLGIGAIIGAGIFVLTGTAAAQFAGPAIVISLHHCRVSAVYLPDCAMRSSLP